MKKILICTIFLSFFFGNFLVAQNDGSAVTNIKAKVNDINTRFIINYDLAKGKYGYWNISLEVYVGGIEDGVKIKPTRGLKGDIGRFIIKGRNKIIIWNFTEELEGIQADIEFKVIATPVEVSPPTKTVDYLAGGGGIAAGLGMFMNGISIRSKKGVIDPQADASNNPIEYYYTFCNPDSEHFNSNFVILDGSSGESPCDDFHAEAEKKYKAGARWLTIGTIFAAAGTYMLIQKPIFSKKMKAFKEEYDLAITPEINWQPTKDNYGIPQNSIGFKITYQFGK